MYKAKKGDVHQQPQCCKGGDRQMLWGSLLSHPKQISKPQANEGHCLQKLDGCCHRINTEIHLWPPYTHMLMRLIPHTHLSASNLCIHPLKTTSTGAMLTEPPALSPPELLTGFSQDFSSNPTSVLTLLFSVDQNYVWSKIQSQWLFALAETQSRKLCFFCLDRCKGRRHQAGC